MTPLQTPMLNNRRSVFKILSHNCTCIFYERPLTIFLALVDRLSNYAMKILKSKGLNN